MTEREADSFKSPNNARHRYDVLPNDAVLAESSLDGISEVTIISKDGSHTVSAEMMALDRLKLRPRLGERSLKDIVASADARWAFEELETGEETDA